MKNTILVIVESPTKAKTLKKFLPAEYQIEASVGHVRDLPQTAAEIPAEFKKEKWSNLGINVEAGFVPLYVIPKDKKAIVNELKKKMKDATAVYLATDEDREGESISWHLQDILQPKVPVRRMVFHEITKTAILSALDHTRDLDMDLVEAQETRRILDRLVGYTISPVLWKKIAYGLSAGRVQSPGLRLLVQREIARCHFKQGEYWDLAAKLETRGESFEAQLVEVDGKKVARGKDFDPETGALAEGSAMILLNETQARQLEISLAKSPWKVESVQEKEVINRPPPPFITSTLQQEANRKLKMSTRDTSRVAQKLYEEGFITYMRTDSPTLSQEALNGARRQISKLYGDEFLSPAPRQYSAKSKGAQESHEAIRPVGSDFLKPEETSLSGLEKALYEMIWKRTLASQMAEAKRSQVQARISNINTVFLAGGSRILFPGYLRVYVEGKDRPEDALDEMESLLPDLKEGDIPNLKELNAHTHSTKAPARFTEAALVQRLEKEGIGRPSTYASIISTLIDRGYVFRKDNALIPSFTGMGVTAVMENSFPELVDYQFTSEMENHLDMIAEGKGEKLKYLRQFFLDADGLLEKTEQQDKTIDPEKARMVILPQIPDIPIRISRYGPYIQTTAEDGTIKNFNLDAETPPSEFSQEKLKEMLELGSKGPRKLGIDPVSGLPVLLAFGRFGPHLQLGEKSEGFKPKTASIPKEYTPENIELGTALSILSLPRQLGLHPESGKPINAGSGRFGPYVVHEGEFRSLKKDDNVFTIDLNRALFLLSEEKSSARRVTVLLDLGVDPKSKRKVQILKGKFGPYVKWGMMNLSLSKNITEEEVMSLTLEDIAKIRDEKKTASPKTSTRKTAGARKKG